MMLAEYPITHERIILQNLAYRFNTAIFHGVHPKKNAMAPVARY